MQTLLLIHNKSVYALIIVALFLLGACTNPRYINSPGVHNAAFLRQQGDFKISAAGAANPSRIFSNTNDDNERAGHSTGFDGQAAVAVTNHFMLTASGMYRSEKDYYDNDDLDDVDRNTKVGYSRNMFNIGAGYYTRMGQSRKVFFNGVVSVGFGSMSSSDNADPYVGERSRYYKANLMKYTLTPSLNFFFTDYFRMSVAPGFSVLKLNNIKTNYSESEQRILGYDKAGSATFGLFEPAILLQAGFKNNDWLKLDMGFNFASDPFTTNGSSPNRGASVSTDTYNVQSRGFLMSLGISVYPHRKR